MRVTSARRSTAVVVGACVVVVVDAGTVPIEEDACTDVVVEAVVGVVAGTSVVGEHPPTETTAATMASARCRLISRINHTRSRGNDPEVREARFSRSGSLPAPRTRSGGHNT